MLHDLLLTNTEELIEKVEVEGNYCDSDHKMRVEESKEKKQTSRIKILGFRKTDYNKLKELVSRIPGRQV